MFNKAYVLMFNDRFFCKFGKSKRVQTAWSLAGAELFLTTDAAFDVQIKLEDLGKNFLVKTVYLEGH